MGTISAKFGMEGIVDRLLAAYKKFMRKTPTWDEQQAFLAVLDTGSLSAAARALNLSQPTVRARIQAIECSLGVVLFTRSMNGLVPTPRARAMAVPARAMANASGALLRAASADAEVAEGTVRIAVSEVVGIEVLPLMLRPLQQKLPNLTYEVELSDSSADLVDQQVDVAVRMHRPEQSALVAKKVRSAALGLFAHRDYLSVTGTPIGRDDMPRHLFIGPDRNRSDLRLAEMIAGGLNLRWSVRTDSHPAQLAAARAGLGIAVFQERIAARDPNLQRVLPELRLPDLETWVVTHENLRYIPRIAAVFDHLVIEFMRN